MISENGNVEEEIMRRITPSQLGPFRAYHNLLSQDKQLFFMYWQTKTGVYKTIVRVFLWCGSITWLLTQSAMERPSIF